MLHNLLIPSMEQKEKIKGQRESTLQLLCHKKLEQALYLLRGHTTDRDLERDLDLDLKKEQ